MFDGSSFEKGKEPQRVLRQLADEACKKGQSFDRAEAELLAVIQGDPSLCAYACRIAAHEEIRMAMTVRRRLIVGATEDESRPQFDGKPKLYSREVSVKVAEWGGKYLAWPLSSRKLLGDATLDDVKAEAEMYEATAQGNARNGRFMRLVERRLLVLKIKAGEKVNKVLDDRELERLMTKARKEPDAA